MLSVTGLKKSYAEGSRTIEAVRDVSFNVTDGEIFSLLGPSGCGKTTILRCLAGLEIPGDGEIDVDGRYLFSRQRGINLPSFRRNVGMVFQSYALWPHMTVFDNVAFPLRYGPEKLRKAVVRERVMSALELVEMQHLAPRPAPSLSGGQQQRVALARAIVYEPSVLLLDEPLSNLDARLRVRTRTLLKGLIKRLKLTTVCVTHDQEEALVLSDRIAVMQHGLISQAGTPFEVYQQPRDRYVANFMGEMNFFAGTFRGPSTNGDIVVDCSFGAVLARNSGSSSKLRGGDTLWVAIRPHHLEVERDTIADSPNRFKGKVASVEFLGGRRRYTLSLGSDICQLESQVLDLREGADILVQFPEERVLLMPRAQDDRNVVVY